MADAAGVGGGVDPGSPGGLGGAVAGADGAVLGVGQGGGLLDADHVVLEAEVGVDVGLVLEVAEDDARAVGEGQDALAAALFVGDGARTRTRRSSKPSLAALPTLRRRRALRPGWRWQSSRAIWQSMAWDLAPPRAPPKPIWVGPSGRSHSAAGGVEEELLGLGECSRRRQSWPTGRGDSRRR